MAAVLLPAALLLQGQATVHGAESKQHQIVISGFEFVPSLLNASPGDEIVWVNQDIVPHNVTVSDTQVAISGDLASGDSFSWVVPRDLHYECGLHPSMKGKLIVRK
jgi:plastocyanin